MAPIVVKEGDRTQRVAGGDQSSFYANIETIPAK